MSNYYEILISFMSTFYTLTISNSSKSKWMNKVKESPNEEVNLNTCFV
jgi:hypothetical protein